MFSKELAEITGILVGDGNFYINEKSGIYGIRIGLNALTEQKYALEFVLPLLENTLGIKCSWYLTKNNEIVLRFYSKQIVLKLKDIVENGVPKWIFSNQEFLIAYLRGLVDTDGSVFSKTTNSSLPVIEFYQKDRIVIEGFEMGLQKLGIRCSRIMKKKTTFCVGIYDKSEVEKFSSLVGFSNFKNNERYLSIISSLGGVAA